MYIRVSQRPPGPSTEGIGAEITKDQEKFSQAADQAGLQASTEPHLGIHDLPTKRHKDIMSRLAPQDLLRLSRTDRRFRVLAHADEFREVTFGAARAYRAIIQLWARGSRDEAFPGDRIVQVREAYKAIKDDFHYLEEGLGDTLIQATLGIPDPKLRSEAIGEAVRQCWAGFTESQKDTLLLGATTIADESVRAEALMSFEIARMTSTDQTNWASAVNALPAEERSRVVKNCLNLTTFPNETNAVLMLRKIVYQSAERARQKAPTAATPAIEDHLSAPEGLPPPHRTISHSFAKRDDQMDVGASAAQRTIEKWLDPALNLSRQTRTPVSIDFKAAYKEINQHFSFLKERGDALLQDTVSIANPYGRRDAIRAAAEHSWHGFTESQQDTLLLGATTIADPSMRADALMSFDLESMTSTQIANWAKATTELPAPDRLDVVHHSLFLSHVVRGLSDEIHGLLRRSIAEIDDPALFLDNKELALENLGPDRSAELSR